jgi:poly-beta-1,6-N-acetyl-D-glucosamine synthase
MKVGIFVPVYRESGQLKQLLDALLADPYRDKEIIVCVDDPTEKTTALVESMKSGVTFRVSAERLGKVNALNTAVQEHTCDIMLFLDSDIEIHQQGFVEKVVEALDGNDLIEIKKKIIRDSFIARIVSYDYLSENLTNLLFSKYMGRCLGLNGSAFAIRRSAWEILGGFDREICEDLDIASRSYIAGLRFGYAEGAEVDNKVSPSWRVWTEQRKRWGAGQAQWIKRCYKMLIRSLVEHPTVLLGALLILFPSLSMFAMGLAFPDTIYVNIASFFLVLLGNWHVIFFLSPVIVMATCVAVLKALSALVSAVAIYSVVYYYFARRLGYAFNLAEFIFFYFVYNPLWFMISIMSLLRALILGNGIRLDWKV